MKLWQICAFLVMVMWANVMVSQTNGVALLFLALQIAALCGQLYFGRHDI